MESVGVRDIIEHGAEVIRTEAAALGPAERSEGLEQPHFLHHGIPIELNTPTDLAPIEATLTARDIA